MSELMQRPSNPPSPTPYEFERLDGETLEEYRQFLIFCNTDADTATDYLLQQGASDMLDLADRWNWMRRRDALWQWRTQARKQRWMGYLDGVLTEMAKRQSYHLKRIRYAMNYEGLADLSEEELKVAAEQEAGNEERDVKGAGLHRKYTEALGLFNRDAELALKVLGVMRDEGGVTINNQVANLIPPGMARVKAIADEWGPPR